MASTVLTTTSSTTSPPAAPPPLAMTMTSKEWVVPPRPKPGRKPATDTPPTKRKAQNRAAQRAFRERRAAKIGELEEEMGRREALHEQAVNELQLRIGGLVAETQTLQAKCRWLEDLLQKERGRQQQQPASYRDYDAGPRASAPTAGIAAPRLTAQPFSISHLISPPETADAHDVVTCGACPSNGPCPCAAAALEQVDALGCGKCTLDTRCACLEETLAATSPTPMDQPDDAFAATVDLKRPLPPGTPPAVASGEKRLRADALETDFTALFAAPPKTRAAAAPQPQHVVVTVEPRDSCGFCKDGTYCVCGDTMVAPWPAAVAPPPPAHSTKHIQTPPPSEDDVVPAPPASVEVTTSGVVKLPGLSSALLADSRAQTLPQAAAGGGGGGGPGTCAQCLADPISGLFCRSLAASYEKSSGGGCCGKAGPGGCCGGGGGGQQQQRGAPGGGGLVGISCADAYKTLASHRHFGEAADEIGAWLPKLRVVSGEESGQGQGQGQKRRPAPMEVEAASIMSVLKGFDVRFGRGE